MMQAKLLSSKIIKTCINLALLLKTKQSLVAVGMVNT